MESASWELALKLSLYNNRPRHSKYFCAGNFRAPPISPRKHPLPAHLVSRPGKTPTFRAPQSCPKSTPTSTTGFREPPYKPTWPQETPYTTVDVFPVVSATTLNVLSFADDTTIITSSPDIKELYAKMNFEL